MVYKWRCNACLRDFDESVGITEYDNFKKNVHVCPLCGKETHYTRVIEWEGSVGETGGYDSVVGKKAKWQS